MVIYCILYAVDVTLNAHLSRSCGLEKNKLEECATCGLQVYIADATVQSGTIVGHNLWP